MTPAVIYARYSSSNQREESIAGQLRECHAYAERHGFRIIHEYTDSAKTATSDKRPAFQQMITDSDAGTFEAVIVWKLDRFARDRYDAAVYRKRLRDNGVKLISAMEAIADSPEGVILEGLLEAMAEYYSANLSENIKRGYYDSALERKVLGTSMLGYRKGEDGRYEIDETGAVIVRRIFQEYISGKPRTRIVADLNADGLRTVRGKPFTKNSIYSILQNEKYCGMYRFKDIEDPDGVPAIVSRETWEEAQKIMQSKSFTKKRADLPDQQIFRLSSKISCGECGSSMTGESARSRSGRIFRYYSCVGRKGIQRNGCTIPRICKEAIEEAVIRTVNEKILTDEMIETFIREYEENRDAFADPDYAAIYRAELSEVSAKIANISKSIEEGTWSRTLTDRLSELEARQDELTALIAQEEKKNPPITADMLRDYFRSMRDKARSDDACQWDLIDVFVRHIWIFKPAEPKGPMRMVLELSTTGSDGEPAKYEVMLDKCSSLVGKPPLYQACSNTVYTKHSMFVITEF